MHPQHQPHLVEARRRQTRLFAEYFAQAITLPESGTLLDVGCAYGDALGVFGGRRPGLTLTGLDLEAYHVELARTLYPQHEFVVGDVFALGDRRWDVIHCSNTLEHFHQRQALQAAAEMLRRCTTLYVMCPYRDPECDVFPEDGERGHDWEGHRWVLDEHSFDGIGDVTYRIIDTPGAWPWGLVAQPELYRQIIYEVRA